MNMTGEAIVLLLKKNKRVVIPDLGAFIRKDGDGRVVFVEFLRKDDGMLAGELGRLYGLSAAEARLAIDRFAAGLKARTGYDGGFVIEGLGTMRMDANGICDLDYDPEIKSPRTAAHPIHRQPAASTAATPPHPAANARPATPVAAQPGQPPRRDVSPAQEKAAPAPQPRPAAQQAGSAAYAPRYTAPQRQDHVQEKRHRMDIVMVIALAAAAIAIAAMIYGAFTRRNTEIELDPAPAQTEQTAAPANQ